MSDVASYLEGASEVVDTIAKAAPGPFGIAAKIAAVALKAGSAIAAAGDDPIVGITRALSPQPEVEGTHDDWDDFVKRNFPPASKPPPSSTDPAPPPRSDIYEED